MNLKRLRQMKGISQVEMCYRLGMSYQNYRNYESGKYKSCSLELEKKISEVLGVNFSYENSKR